MKNQKTLSEAKPLADFAWFLVNTGGCAERLAKFHLERQGFEVYLPMRPVAKKTAEHATPFFPRYLFVRMNMDAPRWDVIRTTIGVQSMVKIAGSIGRVPTWWLDRLREREVFGLIVLGERPEHLEPTFANGERLKVTSGQFGGFDVVFDRACSDARRVHVLLTLLGRVVGVTLPSKSVQRLEA